MKQELDDLSLSLGIDIKVIDGVPHWSERGADTWTPFKSDGVEADTSTLGLYGSSGSVAHSDVGYAWSQSYSYTVPSTGKYLLVCKINSCSSWYKGCFKINGADVANGTYDFAQGTVINTYAGAGRKPSNSEPGGFASWSEEVWSGSINASYVILKVGE